MSVSIVLFPLAIAAVAAWQASRPEVDEEGRTVCHVQTRMRDPELLAAALADTRARVGRDGDALTADWSGVEAAFRRDAQGVWQVDFTGDVDEAKAVAIVAGVDAAYGRQVQAAVLARLRPQAPDAGMRIASETVGSDASVTMVLELEATR